MVVGVGAEYSIAREGQGKAAATALRMLQSVFAEAKNQPRCSDKNLRWAEPPHTQIRSSELLLMGLLRVTGGTQPGHLQHVKVNSCKFHVPSIQTVRFRFILWQDDR